MKQVLEALCRRQWIQDTQAHVKQVLEALENVDSGFPAVATPGNAELHAEVNIANEQQQMAIEQQDQALERIEQAAQRVGQLGLEIHRELGVRYLVVVLLQLGPGARGAPCPHVCFGHSWVVTLGWSLLVGGAEAARASGVVNTEGVH